MQKFEHMPRFECRYKGFRLNGTAQREKGKAKVWSAAVSMMGIGLLLLFVAPVGSALVAGLGLPGAGNILSFVMPALGSALMGVGFIVFLVSLLGDAPTAEELFTQFEIDFGSMPPRWKSDDDVFWKDVKAFFNIP